MAGVAACPPGASVVFRLPADPSCQCANELGTNLNLNGSASEASSLGFFFRVKAGRTPGPSSGSELLGSFITFKLRAVWQSEYLSRGGSVFIRGLRTRCRLQ